MPVSKFILIFFLVLPVLSACLDRAANTPTFSQTAANKTIEPPENYRKLIKNLEPFFQPPKPPKPDEWLASFREDGQTFEEFINQNPTLPTAQRNILYVQPLGKFTAIQHKVITATAEYMQIFFNLPVKLLPDKQFEQPLRLANRRLNPFGHDEQIRTGYILEDVLMPNLPADAAALIAFTDADLFPDKNFSYVFGQASLQNRVGVWSLKRLQNQADFSTFLERTLKIAAHETGHIFSIHHCTKYICVMNGTNHLGETDSHPIDACPECAAKIIWLTGENPRQRYLRLAEFCRKYNLKPESESFVKKAEAVK